MSAMGTDVPAPAAAAATGDPAECIMGEATGWSLGNGPNSSAPRHAQPASGPVAGTLASQGQEAGDSVPVAGAGSASGGDGNHSTDDGGRDHLLALSGVVLSQLTGYVTDERRPLSPHVTVAKMSKLLRKGQGGWRGQQRLGSQDCRGQAWREIRSIPSEAYAGLEGVDAGAVCVGPQVQAHCLLVINTFELIDRLTCFHQPRRDVFATRAVAMLAVDHQHFASLHFNPVTAMQQLLPG